VELMMMTESPDFEQEKECFFVILTDENEDTAQLSER
jgi:hypothetical protein